MFDLLKPDFDKAFPDIDLQITYNTHSSEKLAVAIAGGAAPDIVTQSTRSAAQFIESGAFVPIDFRVFGATNGDSFASRYWPGLANVLRYKGQMYYVPVEVDSLGMFYNKNTLDNAGVGQIPTTWEGLKTLGSKLSRTDEKGWTQVGVTLQKTGIYAALYYASLLRQNGTDWIKADGRPNFSDPKAIQAIEVYADLFRSNASFASANQSHFNTGKAAILVDATYEYFFAKNSTSGFDFGTAQYPVLQGGTPNSSSYAWGFYVPTQSKNAELAWKVIKFLTDSKYGPLWMNEAGLLQPYKASWLMDVLKKEPAFGPFVYGLESAQMEIAHPNYPDIEKTLRNTDQAIINGTASVQQALTQADQVLEPIFTRK
jgi:ABC-type glycerol-3-phosphate transport system substrate-binding protein